MKKKIVRTAGILIAIACFLMFSWIIIITKHYSVEWQNITGLLLFIPLPILLFKNYNGAVLGTAVYLIFGFFRLLSLVPGITETSFNIGKFEISGFDCLSMIFLIVYFILHIDILIDIELDYKERKAKMRERNAVK
jgi:hypothetical protein